MPLPRRGHGSGGCRHARYPQPREASGRLVGPPVFKTGVRARARRRVRFPSASAWRDRGGIGESRRTLRPRPDRSSVDPLPLTGPRVRMLHVMPEVHYARNGDTALAYQIVGGGPIDVVYLSGFINNLDMAWEYPPYARFLRRLASFSRLILTDRRGTGLSDRFSPQDLPPLEVLKDVNDPHRDARHEPLLPLPRARSKGGCGCGPHVRRTCRGRPRGGRSDRGAGCGRHRAGDAGPARVAVPRIRRAHGPSAAGRRHDLPRTLLLVRRSRDDPRADPAAPSPDHRGCSRTEDAADRGRVRRRMELVGRLRHRLRGRFLRRDARPECDLGRSLLVPRDPTSIRHSLVCFPPLTPWESVEYFEDMVGRYRPIGIDEFVLYWPQCWRQAPQEDSVFEVVAHDVIPKYQ
jgi:hypothetical protein